MQIHRSLFILCIFGILSSISCSKNEAKSKDYSVPEAKIEAFLPKGFSVSIPDSPGLQLFVFHGNVNKHIGSLEAGTFSKDILQPEKGIWIYKDTTTKLKIGDVIHYWLFVEKDGLGYQQDLQRFVVKGKNIVQTLSLKSPFVTDKLFE